VTRCILIHTQDRRWCTAHQAISISHSISHITLRTTQASRIILTLDRTTTILDCNIVHHLCPSRPCRRSIRITTPLGQVQVAPRSINPTAGRKLPRVRAVPYLTLHRARKVLRVEATLRSLKSRRGRCMTTKACRRSQRRESRRAPCHPLAATTRHPRSPPLLSLRRTGRPPSLTTSRLFRPECHTKTPVSPTLVSPRPAPPSLTASRPPTPSSPPPTPVNPPTKTIARCTPRARWIPCARRGCRQACHRRRSRTSRRRG